MNVSECECIFGQFWFVMNGWCLPGETSLRKALPICPTPSGKRRRVDARMLEKLVKMPCAVSGRRYATEPGWGGTGVALSGRADDEDGEDGAKRDDDDPSWVENIRLNFFGSLQLVSLQLAHAAWTT
jgi:hypothetical protein